MIAYTACGVAANIAYDLTPLRREPPLARVLRGGAERAETLRRDALAGQAADQAEGHCGRNRNIDVSIIERCTPQL